MLRYACENLHKNLGDHIDSLKRGCETLHLVDSSDRRNSPHSEAGGSTNYAISQSFRPAVSLSFLAGKTNHVNDMNGTFHQMFLFIQGNAKILTLLRNCFAWRRPYAKTSCKNGVGTIYFYAKRGLSLVAKDVFSFDHLNHT